MNARTIIEEVDPGEPDQPRRCRYCVGGRVSAEPGSSLRYTCPDCNGTGYIVPEKPESGDEDELEESATRVVEALLSESLVNGEFWIFEDGSIFYCDGDIGDINHEGYVIQHAQSLVLDAMNLDSDMEMVDRDGFLEKIRQAFVEDDATDEEKAAVESGEMDDFDVASRMAQIHGVEEHLLDVALDRGDPRKYAMQHWHWHALRNDHVETWQINAESLKIIARGIMNALDEQGEEDVDPETEFWVDAAQGARSVKLTYAQIEAEDFGEDFKPAPQAPNDQLRKLDREQAPEFYQGKLGD